MWNDEDELMEEGTFEVPVCYHYTVDRPFYCTDDETVYIEATEEEIAILKDAHERGLSPDEIEGLDRIIAEATALAEEDAPEDIAELDAELCVYIPDWDEWDDAISL